ncbi:MAG: methyl-accepting chemotaxis protein, partial [Nitrosarchaeum sp.]
NETSSELNTLNTEIGGFGATLNSASGNIDTSVNSISNSVFNIEEASSQLNSLFFPIVASIGIIVALQIAILARRR